MAGIVDSKILFHSYEVMITTQVGIDFQVCRSAVFEILNWYYSAMLVLVLVPAHISS